MSNNITVTKSEKETSLVDVLTTPMLTATVVLGVIALGLTIYNNADKD